jgi:probable selenium-dependent hydroxylase accessory protein YqeC
VLISAGMLEGGHESISTGRGGDLELYRALGIARGDIVAFVGAGGKSSAILQSAAELGEAGVPVLVAPTTKMFVSEAERVARVLTSEDVDGLRSKVTQALGEQEAVVAGSGILSKKRVGGVDPAWVPQLAPENGVTLVEADGSRRRPLKGTAPHEPLLPHGVTLVVVVGGLRAFGEPLDQERVHRLEVFSELTGIGPGHTIDAGAFVRSLLAGLHNTPENARQATLLTDIEPGRVMSDASVVAHGLWRRGVSKVVLSSLPNEMPGRVWTL